MVAHLWHTLTARVDDAVYNHHSTNDKVPLNHRQNRIGWHAAVMASRFRRNEAKVAALEERPGENETSRVPPAAFANRVNVASDGVFRPLS